MGDQQSYGSSGGSWFLPAAAGFMLGRVLGTAPSPYFMRRDGGAVAFATANRILMLEHSIYSVISPEGCASILWKDAEKMREAATALRLTAQDLLKLGVIDQIVKEPLGGAQRDRDEAIKDVGKALEATLKEFARMKPGDIVRERREKFLDMGAKGLAA